MSSFVFMNQISDKSFIKELGKTAEEIVSVFDQVGNDLPFQI